MFRNKNMTKIDALWSHRRMWKWIAKEIDKTGEMVNIHAIKRRYIDLTCEKRIACDCFCCEYALENNEKIQCQYCPVVWNGDYSAECMDGEYAQILNAKSVREQYELAMKISQLPKRNTKLKME